MLGNGGYSRAKRGGSFRTGQPSGKRALGGSSTDPPLDLGGKVGRPEVVKEGHPQLLYRLPWPVAWKQST